MSAKIYELEPIYTRLALKHLPELGVDWADEVAKYLGTILIQKLEITLQELQELAAMIGLEEKET